MAQKEIGKQSVRFEHPPFVIGESSIVGEKEGNGPYGSYFDQIEYDPKAGANSWEEAEEKFQEAAGSMVLEKTGLKPEDIRYIIAGDLLGQLIASSFGLMDFQIPILGVYGACSTMAESIAIAAMLIDGQFADKIMALTSSHFSSAEKQFRFPSAYSNQRPEASTWTVTGSGAFILSAQPVYQPSVPKMVQIEGVTTGKIVDFGIKDSMNMGACMAPAAADVIEQNFQDFHREPGDYDKIITGDLGKVGKEILQDILETKGYDISNNYMDCGIEIYEEDQNVQAGGSGCGCSAVMLAGFVMKKLKTGQWNKVLFVPTGALLSKVSFNEGSTVPGIAHAIVLSTCSQK